VVSQGPNAVVKVDFVPETLGKGLVKKENVCDLGVALDQCRGFDVGTSDGKWTNATVTISGGSILVSTTLLAGTTVTGVCYAFANYPVATLYNGDGLPALPFAFPNH